MTGVVELLAVLILLAAYVTWTAGRLDRLHARVDAAWAALDAQLVRRAAAARALVPLVPDPRVAVALDAAAHAALEAGPQGREPVENELTRQLRAALGQAPAGPERTEVEAAAARVGLARAFHNAAVQNTRTVRLRRMPRALHLAGHRELPVFFEIDDTTTPD